ncbi:MAG: hypothetical protein ACI97A_003067 [Planctomycetota bacterium]|jgi:hypothetical protein
MREDAIIAVGLLGSDQQNADFLVATFSALDGVRSLRQIRANALV